MTKEDERKLRMLQHAVRTGHVAKTCRYFGKGSVDPAAGVTFVIQPDFRGQPRQPRTT